MAKQSKKSSDGCLWIFLVGVFSIIFFGIIKVFSPLASSIVVIIAVIVSIFLVVKMLGKPSIKVILRNGIIIFLFLFGVQFIGKVFIKILKTSYNETPTFTKEEKISKTSVIENSDTLALYTTNRIWKDNYGNHYETELSVRERDYLKLKNHINSYNPPTTGHFWGNLYDYIDRTDTPSLDLVLEAFNSINDSKKLNKMEFAEMVVSCIQDIPYSLVFQGECESADNYEESIKRILDDCPECCIGNIKYGIQNPVSFLQNLKGDCDTRTVLIYSVLKHFDYDIAIVNSEFYRHSILGINLPANGLHKMHNGKKYILWETTAKYFEVGTLSPNFNNVAHWNVILTSK